MLALKLEGTPAEDFETAIGLFLLRLRAKNDSPLTISWYNERLRRFAQFVTAHGGTPATFTTKTIENFILSLLQKLKPQTVNSYIRAIKAFCSFLVREGIRGDNPIDGIAKIQEPIYYPRTLSDEQIVQLVNTISKNKTFVSLRDLALVALMLDTGLRVSEVLEMKIEDVDIANGFVRVIGKRGRERMVPIGDNTRMILHRYLVKRLSFKTGDWFFVNSLGLKLTRRSVHSSIRKWAKKAGIEGVRVSPHSLRFTFVRKWLQSGGDSIVLQRILGHTSPKMTSYYAHLFAMDLKDVHRRHSPLDAIAPALKIPRKRIV